WRRLRAAPSFDEPEPDDRDRDRPHHDPHRATSPPRHGTHGTTSFLTNPCRPPAQVQRPAVASRPGHYSRRAETPAKPGRLRSDSENRSDRFDSPLAQRRNFPRPGARLSSDTGRPLPNSPVLSIAPHPSQ